MSNIPFSPALVRAFTGRNDRTQRRPRPASAPSVPGIPNIPSNTH